MTGRARPSVHLDLETLSDLATLADPDAYLARHENALVILDRVRRAPALFQSLRGLIDRGRRKGRHPGRLLLHGSVTIDLLRPTQAFRHASCRAKPAVRQSDGETQ
jgi:predicted AAA+ superfamily ATPase